MRCGIYVRVSTDDQRDNGYSIDSQLRMIKEYWERCSQTLTRFPLKARQNFYGKLRFPNNNHNRATTKY